MSEAPLRRIAATAARRTTPVASECWQCHRRDWRGAPKIRTGHSPVLDPVDRSRFTGCMVYLTMALIAVVVLAFQAGPDRRPGHLDPEHW